ncbi:hypothetical protein [Mumia sp. DW29H23]|uniref:hypothetical protein n=1 Tax=Mumia sp. DW29H23 TaxID=3421241 RepID=UPI003D69AB1C
MPVNRRQVLKGAAAGALGAAVAQGAAATASPAAATAPGALTGRPRPAAPPLGEPGSLDDRPFPAYDYSRANKLPREMTGYWQKSFLVGEEVRTAKIYLSPETPIRSYYTVIAVPDGVDTEDFLQRSGWVDVAFRQEEGLFVLEPGAGGWRSAEEEAAYVAAAMAFYQSNRYFSIFGLHYLVGYGDGGPALEAWAVANPLRVISQAYVGSRGLGAAYLDSYADREFDGRTDNYVPVEFPEGFDLISYEETVLPTWYVDPRRSFGDSLAYWQRANDTDRSGSRDRSLGVVYGQRRRSDRWMTSHAGPLSQVAVDERRADAWDRATTSRLVAFLTFYTRYENFFAYGNQLYERGHLDDLGIEVRTMMVEGYVREYLVHVPRSARRRWGRSAPVVFVWPGNSQTDKVFLDATQWWKVAEEQGCILVVVCEQYSNTSVSVSHSASNTFYRQLREVVLREYAVDPTRFYSTGQSAGSMLTQSFAIGAPASFAAVASTSGAAAPNASGTVRIDGVDHPASNAAIPNYLVYGYGDLANLEGDLFDDTVNTLDQWAAYHLAANGLALGDVDPEGERSGWEDRFETWTWTQRHGRTDVPVLKVTRNHYRSHNTMAEETPLLWEYLEHFSAEVDRSGNVTRYYSPSAFRRRGDRIRLG